MISWIKAGIKYVRGKTWALKNRNGSLATHLNVIKLRLKIIKLLKLKLKKIC